MEPDSKQVTAGMLDVGYAAYQQNCTCRLWRKILSTTASEQPRSHRYFI